MTVVTGSNSTERNHDLAIENCLDGRGVSADQDQTAADNPANELSVSDTDNGPSKNSKKSNSSPERLCIATRKTCDPAHMIRFVAGPDGSVVPDLKATLPGRGAWVTNNRGMIALAIQKNLFSRAFRKKVHVSPQLVEQIAQLRMASITGYLAMANKAGLAITGFDKALETLKNGKAVMVIHSSEAASDGRNKLAAAISRYQTRFPDAPPLTVFDGIEGLQLDKTLGKPNITHIALKDGPVVATLLGEIEKYIEYQKGDCGEEPDTRWPDRPEAKGHDKALADPPLNNQG